MSDSPRPLSLGCGFLITALIVFLALLAFAVWVPIRQISEIKKFTQEEPGELQYISTNDHPEALENLTKKLKSFRDQLNREDETAVLKLSVAELTTAQLNFDTFKEQVGILRVNQITPAGLQADINYKLNGMPRLASKEEGGGITNTPRYLVGQIILTPRLNDGQLELLITDLKVPAAKTEIPRGFLENIGALNMLPDWRQDKTIAPLMAKLTEAETIDGYLVLTRNPKDPVPDAISDAEFRSSGFRFLLIFFGILSALAVLALFSYYRRYRKQLAEAEGEGK